MQKRLPVELRRQLLDMIYSGQSFRAVLRDLSLTSTRCGGNPDRRRVVSSLRDRHCVFDLPHQLLSYQPQ